MFKSRSGIYLLISVLTLQLIASFSAQGQTSWGSNILWKELMRGLQHADIETPDKSVVGDSKLTVLKIDTKQFEFNLLTTSERGGRARTAPDWANEFEANVVINAGMYNYDKKHSNKGFMKNYKHVNNPVKSDYYNALLAMNPKNTDKQPFSIIDITEEPWDEVKNQYHTLCQTMRMISSKGEGMEFRKRPNQSCSMILAATDTIGNIYIVFTRSPYTHNTMIKYLQRLPFGIRTTAYLEGGPETSLFVNTGDTIIAKFGSYVSNTCNNDDNDHFRFVPNVIALKRKK